MLFLSTANLSKLISFTLVIIWVRLTKNGSETINVIRGDI